MKGCAEMISAIKEMFFCGKTGYKLCGYVKLLEILRWVAHGGHAVAIDKGVGNDFGSFFV